MTVIYEKELNEAQSRAVLHDEGPVLVIAGAGSGKTRTLVYRVARLVETGVYPESIMLLTFTRRAAEEMLFRAANVLDERCGQVQGGTFHSIANRMLRFYGDRINIKPDFVILDRTDSEEIISWVRKDRGLSGKQLRFPKRGTLASIFSRSANTGKTLEELIDERFSHLEIFLDDIIGVWEDFVSHKRRNGLLDYDDLLLFFQILLQEDTRARETITRRYNHILVDEFQDTNHMQADIVEMLSGAQQNIMAVGDDSQSIYSFRGARFQNIIDFPQRFPDTTIIKLEQNYRSTQPVLTIANTIIADASTPYTKCLFTVREGGPEPVISGAEDEHQQSLKVASGIAQLIDRGVRPAEIAVLFRASFHSFDLEVELNNRGVSFVKFGGYKFLELAHIKDVMSHLRVVSNPGDEFSWQRVLMLVPGVGMSRAGKILAHLKNGPDVVEGLLTCPEAIKNPRLAELGEVLNAVKGIHGSPVKRLEMVVDYYQDYLESHYDDHPKRRRHLDELLALAGRFSRTRDFMDEVTLDPPQEDRGAAGSRGDVVTLSTIHSSKGLEWEAVFVIWVAEGWFPSRLAMEDEEDLEEERRLMYVAVTRAKKHLSIFYPRSAYKRGEGHVWTQPSRFIKNIESDRFSDNQLSTKKGTGDFLADLQLKYGESLTGRIISHPSFGKGMVLGHQGRDSIMVDFETKGIINLNLNYAPIQIVDG